MLLVGLLVTMGIGSSFSTVPILAAIFVPLCVQLGFSPMAIVCIVGTAGALGDAGSPASDSTLGPTSGLNIDGQHHHIWDTVVPTFPALQPAAAGVWLGGRDGALTRLSEGGHRPVGVMATRSMLIAACCPGRQPRPGLLLIAAVLEVDASAGHRPGRPDRGSAECTVCPSPGATSMVSPRALCSWFRSRSGSCPWGS